MRRTAFVNQVHLGPRRTIPSQKTCDDLNRALPYVPLGSQNFARSLIQNHATYNGWTPKQSEHAELLLERAREAYRERNAATATVAEREKVSADAMRGLARMFKRGATKIKAKMNNGTVFVLKDSVSGSFIISVDAYCGNLRKTGTLDLRAAYKPLKSELIGKLDEIGLGYLLHNQDDD